MHNAGHGRANMAACGCCSPILCAVDIRKQTKKEAVLNCGEGKPHAVIFRIKRNRQKRGKSAQLGNQGCEGRGKGSKTAKIHVSNFAACVRGAFSYWFLSLGNEAGQKTRAKRPCIPPRGPPRLPAAPGRALRGGRRRGGAGREAGGRPVAMGRRGGRRRRRSCCSLTHPPAAILCPRSRQHGFMTAVSERGGQAGASPSHPSPVCGGWFVCFFLPLLNIIFGGSERFSPGSGARRRGGSAGRAGAPRLSRDGGTRRGHAAVPGGAERTKPGGAAGCRLRAPRASRRPEMAPPGRPAACGRKRGPAPGGPAPAALRLPRRGLVAAVRAAAERARLRGGSDAAAAERSGPANGPASLAGRE